MNVRTDQYTDKLTRPEYHTEEYWLEVVAVGTERYKVRTKTTEGLMFPSMVQATRLVSSLLYGARTNFFLIWICRLSRTKSLFTFGGTKL